MPKVVLIGAVRSAEITLHKLVHHGFEVALVLGQRPLNKAKVSGLVDMEPFCTEHQIPFIPFTKINQQDIIEAVKDVQPELIFGIGFSQIIGPELLSIPSRGVIGFHPTMLPRGRGRAPIAWLIIKQEDGAANFFLMGQGADDGPIFVQKPFSVAPSDYASDVEQKILEAIAEALDEWLPQLKLGKWQPIVQDETRATYYGKRSPSDGHLNWCNRARDIHRLIRASAPPHPGAYSYFGKYKLIIHRASIDEERKFSGVVGRILAELNGAILVQCGEGALWLEDFHLTDTEGTVISGVKITVGSSLGYNIEDEIFKIVNRSENG